MSHACIIDLQDLGDLCVSEQHKLVKSARGPAILNHHHPYPGPSSVRLKLSHVPSAAALDVGWDDVEIYRGDIQPQM